MLAVNQLAINFHVKDAALAFNQLAVDAIGFFNCGRQTGGLRCVVSHHAKSDFDLHISLVVSGIRNAILK